MYSVRLGLDLYSKFANDKKNYIFLHVSSQVAYLKRRGGSLNPQDKIWVTKGLLSENLFLNSEILFVKSELGDWSKPADSALSISVCSHSLLCQQIHGMSASKSKTKTSIWELPRPPAHLNLEEGIC